MTNPRIPGFGRKIAALCQAVKDGVAAAPGGHPPLPSTQRGLAVRLNVREPTLSMWCTEERGPDPRAVRNIARLFGFAPAEAWAAAQGLDLDSESCWDRWWGGPWACFAGGGTSDEGIDGSVDEFAERYREAARAGELVFQVLDLPAAATAPADAGPAAAKAGELAHRVGEAVRALAAWDTGASNLMSRDEAEYRMRRLESLRELLRIPADGWTELELERLVSLQESLHYMFEGERGTGLREALDLGPLFGLLRLLDRLLPGQGGAIDSEVTIDNRQEPVFAELREAVRAQLGNPAVTTAARAAVGTLADHLDDVAYRPRRCIRLKRLDDQARLIRAQRSGDFRRIEDLVSFLIGIRVDRAPALAIFKDADADWAPEMVVIPSCPDGFLMGSPEDEPGRSDDERQHLVRIQRRFALARDAMTWTAYDAFCRATGHAEGDDRGWGRETRPAIRLSWEDAAACCAWLSHATGVQYRLPSESEWEYACRGDRGGRNQTPFCPEVARSGKGAILTAEEANFDDRDPRNGSPEGRFLGQTVPVDHPDFQANGFRLRQMHGNVFEWVQDAWSAGYQGAPVDGSALEDSGSPAKLTRRVRRGGSWGLDPWSCRSAYRSRGLPDDWGDNTGFRPARTLLPLFS